MTDTWAGFLAGAATAFGLCASIGPLALNILRQATRPVCGIVAATITVGCQSLLMTLSILGLGQVLASNSVFLGIGVCVGVVFALLYGTRSCLKALFPRSAGLKSAGIPSFQQTIIESVGINLFNPIALVQVIILVGGISATYSSSGRFAFLGAAVTVVTLWFFGLAFGAAWLSTIIAKPMIQRGLDGAIGILMYAITWNLIVTT